MLMKYTRNLIFC